MLQADILRDPYTYDELKLEGTGAVNPESGRKYPLKQGFLAFWEKRMPRAATKVP